MKSELYKQRKDAASKCREFTFIADKEKNGWIKRKSTEKNSFSQPKYWNVRVFFHCRFQLIKKLWNHLNRSWLTFFVIFKHQFYEKFHTYKIIENNIRHPYLILSILLYILPILFLFLNWYSNLKQNPKYFILFRNVSWGISKTQVYFLP